jgi:hypothetical protein
MDPTADSSHTIDECGTLRQQAKAWAPASAGVSESFFFGLPCAFCRWLFRRLFKIRLFRFSIGFASEKES